MVGGMVVVPAPSLVTVAVKVQNAELPDLSTAVYVKNVMPRLQRAQLE